MNTARVPVESPADERLSTIAYQVEATMRIAEAIGGLMMNVLTAARDGALDDTRAAAAGEEPSEDSDKRFMAAAEAAMERLDAALRGDL